MGESKILQVSRISYLHAALIGAILVPLMLSAINPSLIFEPAKKPVTYTSSPMLAEDTLLISIPGDLVEPARQVNPSIKLLVTQLLDVEATDDVDRVLDRFPHEIRRAILAESVRDRLHAWAEVSTDQRTGHRVYTGRISEDHFPALQSLVAFVDARPYPRLKAELDLRLSQQSPDPKASVISAARMFEMGDKIWEYDLATENQAEEDPAYSWVTHPGQFSGLPTAALWVFSILGAALFWLLNKPVQNLCHAVLLARIERASPAIADAATNGKFTPSVIDEPTSANGVVRKKEIPR